MDYSNYSVTDNIFIDNEEAEKLLESFIIDSNQ